MKCGLLGRKLGNSYSPQIHGMLGGYTYSLFEKEPEALEAFLHQGDFDGLNVTVPYKKAVIPYLDTLSDRAAALGAVNTIVRRNGRLIGHNTDYFGFETLLRSTNLDVSGKKVLVLGSGGASCTAVAVLKEAGAQVVVISRTGADNYKNLDRHRDAALIVNTTPVGMYPDCDRAPLELTGFPDLEGVLDVIYNPARTQLLQQAEARGCIAANGLLMLVAQAWESAQWFTEVPLGAEKIPEIYDILRFQAENIILIGMPGCGKSTIGRLLAKKLGREFVDIDALIAANAGKTIPEIFASDGDPGFRALETATLRQVCGRSGLVISTGGGCVTQPCNYPLLHQNGQIIWLQRDLELLPTDGRPLSQAHSLSDLYQMRKPLYESFADCTISNGKSVSDTVDAILQKIRSKS